MWQLNPAYIELNEAGQYQTIPTADIAIDLRDWAGQAAEPYVFRDDELIVTRGHLGDDLRGLSVFAHHLQELMLAGAIGGFALSALRRGVPNGYLKVNSPNLTRPKAQELQTDWMAAHGGPIKKIAVLNATTEFHAINLDPAAMQLAQMRDYSIVDWCLVFGINPWMLGVAQRGDNTYANVESRMTEFHQLTLFPWARRFESSCDAELPSGTDMRINFGALLRPETLARYQAHRIALTEPAFLTVDEVRDIEGRDTMAEELAAEIEALAALGLPAPAYGGNQPSGTGPPLPGAVPAAAGLTTPGAAPPRP
jgi:HK97 family phage portal protein